MIPFIHDTIALAFFSIMLQNIAPPHNTVPIKINVVDSTSLLGCQMNLRYINDHYSFNSNIALFKIYLISKY